MADTNSRTKWRLNRRAITTIAILTLVLGGVILALQLTRTSRLGSQAAQQIEDLLDESEQARANGDFNLAIRKSNQALKHLERYIEDFPDDTRMLFLQARMMAEQATGVGTFEERVAQMHQRLVARYPDHEEADEARLRAAEIYIRRSDGLRDESRRVGMEELAVGQLRYDAAINLIGQINTEDPKLKPRAEELLGRAQEGKGSVTQALSHYENAFERYREGLSENPEFIKGIEQVSARRARLLRDQNNPAAADDVLDQFVAALPERVEPLLFRYRFYQETQDNRAETALNEAVKQFPKDPEVLMAAVEFSLARDETANARDLFEILSPLREEEDEDAGLSESERKTLKEFRENNDLRLMIIAGMIELQEQHPEQAMGLWREGLRRAAGTDADLMWWVAYLSINNGKLKDADRQIEQFQRLSGERDDSRYLLLQALLLQERNNPKEAIEILDKLKNRADMSEMLQTKVTQALASCYQSLGDPKMVDELYQEITQDTPLQAIIDRATLLARSNRTSEAIQWLSQGLQIHGNDPALLLPLLLLQITEQAKRAPQNRSWAQFDQAAAELRKVLSEKSNRRADLELMTAERELLDNQRAQATNRLEAALEIWPTNPRLWTALAELQRQANDPDGAVALLERGLKEANDAPVLRLALARLLVAEGRGREAQQCLTENIDELPERSQEELWKALGNLRMAQGDYEGAQKAFEQWSKVAAQSPEPILALFGVALQTNRIPQAELALDRLKRISGESALAYQMAELNLWLHQAERGQTERLDDCVDRIDRILKNAPELAVAHLLNVRIRQARDETEEAIEAYRQAWNRGNQEGLLRLADLLGKGGRVEELEQLMAASRSAARVGDGLILAQALLGAGAGEQAADQWRMSATSDPNSQNIAENLLAQAHLRAGRLGELETLLEREVGRADPRDPSPWLQLVTIQARLGRSSATLDQTIRRALARVSGIPRELLEARLRWAAGDLETADQILEEALDQEIVDPDLMTGAALFYQQTGRSDRAEPLLERLMSNPDVGSAASLQLAMVLTERVAGDPDLWQRALELASDGPMDPSRRLAIAMVLARSPDPEQQRKAIDAFEALLADLPVMHPRAIEARNQLAPLLVRLGQTDRAAQVTKISADQPTASAEALMMHVRTLLLANRLTEADTVLGRLQLLRPGDPDVAALRSHRLFLANADDPSNLADTVTEQIGSSEGDLFARAVCLQLLDTGTPEAIEAADQIAQALIKHAPKYEWLSALVLAIQGRSAEALERCSSAVATVDLTDPIDRVRMAEAILKLIHATAVTERPQMAERASPIVESMLDRRRGDPDLLSLRAMVSVQEGDYDAGAKRYREVLERRPNDLDALYNLALVLSEGLGQPEESLDLIDQVATRIGSVPDVLVARAVILTRLGRFDEAIRNLNQAIEMEPSAVRRFYLARAYHKAGQEDLFRRHLDQARRDGLNPDAIDHWHHEELTQLLAL